MTNLFFKSANRLIKNSPLTEGYLMTKLESIQKELRHQRQDNKDIKLMLNKLLVDKHLQAQVDDYFEKDPFGSSFAESNRIKAEDEVQLAYGTAIKRGLTIAGKIDKKYNINKLFIDKYFPPGYRKTAHKIVDITGALGGGYGLYGFAQSLLAPDTPGNSAPIPFQKQLPTTGKSYKTRSRYSKRNYCRNTSKFQSSRFK